MEHPGKGQLKIFFSYAEGSGKTHAMLRAVKEAKRQGARAIVGFIAPHTSEETLALLKGMEQLPPLLTEGTSEFDLDQALLKHPDLIAVDELAHTNSAGCRHHKRYQDIEELLNAGINVYTTVNVSSIESLHDTVASITGSTTWDRIPDAVFDNADQVELIDMEPQVLIGRLRECDGPEPGITVEQLTALREIALRRCADRVRRLAEGLKKSHSFNTDEHIMACLSSAPSNAKIIRTAARMAGAFNCQFTALFVETPDFAVASEDNKRRLESHRQLAEQLGGDVEIVYGEDVPYQIAEYARLSGVTKIVLGRSAVTRRHSFGKPSVTELLLAYAPEIDIHIIPDQIAETPYHPKRAKRKHGADVPVNILKSAGILMGATLLSLLFHQLGFTDSNIIMVYILGVLLTSIATSHRVYSLVSSIASVFIFNYLFTVPRFSLAAYGTGYPVTFVVMFLTAFITGTFAIRYKEQAGQSAKIAHRTRILFDADQLLSKAGDKEKILSVTAGQVMKLLNRDIVIFDTTDTGKLSEPVFFKAGDSGTPEKAEAPACDIPKELETAEWVLKNNHSAGATTETLSDARYLYLALRVNDRVYGVIGIDVEKDPLDASEHGILLSILGECALALENEKNVREKEAAAVLAESEQLRANLLRTISHDLRTPLTSISGNASNLMSNGENFDEKTRQRLYADIYDDSMWLINLVENLLSATRIEEGRMTLRTSTELLGDLIEEAVRYCRRKNRDRKISIEDEDEMLLVRADAKLIIQVITNLIDNAMKYTPADSDVAVSVRRAGNMAEVSVADHGPGILEGDKEKIFDKFYCGSGKIADSRRSLGLGLFLCRAIVEAHGGKIWVEDHVPHGAVFRFTIPREEIVLHE